MKRNHTVVSGLIAVAFISSCGSDSRTESVQAPADAAQTATTEHTHADGSHSNDGALDVAPRVLEICRETGRLVTGGSNEVCVLQFQSDSSRAQFLKSPSSDLAVDGAVVAGTLSSVFVDGVPRFTVMDDDCSIPNRDSLAALSIESTKQGWVVVGMVPASATGLEFTDTAGRTTVEKVATSAGKDVAKAFYAELEFEPASTKLLGEIPEAEKVLACQ
jgi:hypothetical protein